MVRDNLRWFLNAELLQVLLERNPSSLILYILSASFLKLPLRALTVCNTHEVLQIEGWWLVFECSLSFLQLQLWLGRSLCIVIRVDYFEESFLLELFDILA